MSADNGIYILEAKDGYRVIHAQAIENLWWWKEDDDFRPEINPAVLYDYFHEAEVLTDKLAALAKAEAMYSTIMNSDFPMVEYGIGFIPGWDNTKDFPVSGKDLACALCDCWPGKHDCEKACSDCDAPQEQMELNFTEEPTNKRLTITYEVPGGIDLDLDKQLVDALKEIGWNCWAAGLYNGQRDMQFDYVGDIDDNKS